MNAPAMPTITSYPVSVEVDFYGREDDGVRYHLQTARIVLRDEAAAQRLPFLLTDAVGQHHGIRRVRVCPAG